MFSCEYCEIFKSFFYRTSAVATSSQCLTGFWISFWLWSPSVSLNSVTAWKVSKYGVCWCVYSRIRIEYKDLLVNLRIQSEYGKIRTRQNSVFERFSHSQCQPEWRLRESWRPLFFCQSENWKTTNIVGNEKEGKLLVILVIFGNLLHVSFFSIFFVIIYGDCMKIGCALN